MHVLVAPVCRRFSHPKKRGCLSGRTICKPSVQAFTQGKLLFVCLFQAQKLSKLASWRNLSSLALYLMETCLVFPLFSLAEHFLAAEPEGTCLFWNLYLPGLFFFKPQGRARLENNASEKSWGFLCWATVAHLGKDLTFVIGPEFLSSSWESPKHNQVIKSLQFLLTLSMPGML